MIGGVAVVLAGLMGLAAVLNHRPPPGPDNCAGVPTRNTVILIDLSEQITDQTVAEIKARAMAYISDSVAMNERVSVFSVSDLSKRSLTPTVSVCRPPDSGNRAIENVQVIRKKFQSTFTKPLEEAVSLRPGDTNESPIAQAITDISLSQYLSGDTNTLLVFSDMLENTDKFSVYRCDSPEQVIRQFRESRRGAMERPVFKNTKVVLHLIPRLNQSRSALECRDKLWVWFFGDNSGSKAALDVRYLPGGAPMNEGAARAKS